MRSANPSDQILVKAIRQEIEDLGDIPQIAIELVDEGAISDCPDTGGEIEYIRSPWRRVVWLGERADAIDALKRLAAHPLVRSGLHRGVKITIHGRGHTDLDAQRKESAAIFRLLGRPVPHLSKPLPDQIIYHATLSASGSKHELRGDTYQRKQADGQKRIGEDTDGQTESQKAGSNPNGLWCFEPGEVSFMGQRIEVAGIKLKILRALVENKRALLHDHLVERVWGNDSVIDRQTIHTHLAQLRGLLRDAFKLRGKDPIRVRSTNHTFPPAI